MKIRDVMIRNPITISPDDTVGHTLGIFEKFNILSVPIISKGEIVGIVTKQDLYTKSTNRQEKISDIMSKNPLTISPDEELVKAIDIIKRTNIREIIVAKGTKLVGILTINDIINKIHKINNT